MASRNARTPRILILYTGGTFGMTEAKGHRGFTLPSLSKRELSDRLRDRVPELGQLARCDIEILLNRDSAHIGPKEWILFARTIRAKWKSYDGVVLLHGTDTLAYTASALSFLLRPCLKPVVLTGAQRPLSALRTDARRNLISAVEIAASGPRPQVNRVSVFFDDLLIQGNRARKRSSTDFAAFESPKAPPLASVGAGIRYEAGRAPRAPRRGPALRESFSSRVAVLQITPNFPARAVEEGLLDRLDGLVLVAFPSCTGPTQDPGLLGLLGAARASSIPVVLATADSGSSGRTDPARYAAGNELLRAGCHWAGAMTVECAFVKASWILGQTDGRARFGSLWKKDYAGEGSTEA